MNNIIENPNMDPDEKPVYLPMLDEKGNVYDDEADGVYADPEDLADGGLDPEVLAKEMAESVQVAEEVDVPMNASERCRENALHLATRYRMAWYEDVALMSNCHPTTASNVMSHMAKSGELVRIKRGMYGLPETASKSKPKERIVVTEKIEKPDLPKKPLTMIIIGTNGTGKPLMMGNDGKVYVAEVLNL